jgi:hypothetical protein
VAGPGIPACFAALVTLRIAQRLGIQQCVQGFLHAIPYQPIKVVLDALIVNRDYVPRWTLSQFRAVSPTQLCETYLNIELMRDQQMKGAITA